MPARTGGVLYDPSQESLALACARETLEVSKTVPRSATVVYASVSPIMKATHTVVYIEAASVLQIPTRKVCSA